MFKIRTPTHSPKQEELVGWARILIRRAHVRLQNGRSPIYVAVEMQWAAVRLGCEAEVLAELDEMEEKGG